jgi:hypothetical protein
VGYTEMNYYTEYWDCGNEDRNSEVITCINNNIKSNLFDKIFIFSENKEERLLENPIITSRITYQYVFDNCREGINVFCNSDIEFDETIKLAENIKNDEFYALTRYEDNIKLHKFDDPYKGQDSQDVWIWKDACKIKNANFSLGLPGCDNKIAYFAVMNRYKVKNPSLSIKTYHKHLTNIRDGSSADLSKRLPPPYAMVPISEI